MAQFENNNECYTVADLHIDLYNSITHFDHSKYDFQILAQYIDPHNYDVIIRRLDQNFGWNIGLQVLACDFRQNREQMHKIIHIGPTNDPEVIVHVFTELEIQPSKIKLTRLPRYKMVQPPEPIAISRQKFNEMFKTDIVTLPALLYAVGVKDGVVYMYNEPYSYYNEIIHQINNLLSVYLTRAQNNTSTSTNNISNPCPYFIICAGDGYPENHYHSTSRTIPKIVGETEYQNQHSVVLDNPNEYAKMYSKQYVLTQSQHIDYPFAIGIPDRHYFFCNLYNPFRSFHRGIPFRNKTNKIVFGARNERGSKYNFTKRRDIECNQRQYFVSNAVPKDNIYCSEHMWIDSTHMVDYKYILDIDGGACTWDATAWKLNSGSVIFTTESTWRQWFYDEYQPWTHYVPVDDDFANIQERFQWCESHPEECEQMVANCLALFQKIFRFHNMIDYCETVLDKVCV